MITQLVTTFSDYTAQLREFIQAEGARGAGGDESEDVEFNRLAQELFALQFDHNAPYRRFCQAREVSPGAVRNWRDIPAAPTASFKELELTSLPAAERARVFHSSGTTEQRPSRHFHSAESLAIYEASLLPWFREHLLPEAGAAKVNFLALTPSPGQSPNSSLVHMFETVGREFGFSQAIFCGEMQSDGIWNLNWEQTLASLRSAVVANRPLVVLGTAFGFVHLLDQLAEHKINLELPAGSRVLETGGYKGRSRAMPKAELHALITARLGIPAAGIVCEYGMSELSSQAYDAVAGKARAKGRRFRFPAWARAQIISSETGREAG